MKENIGRWVIISLISSAASEIVSGVTKENYAFYMGFIFVYIFATLAIPLLVGIIAKFISKGSQKVFVKTVNITQYACVTFVVISLIGQIKYYLDTVN